MLKYSAIQKTLTLILTAIIFLPSCTLQLQKELNDQKKQVAAIENELLRARKNQANTNSEIDGIKRELQFIKGNLEENAHLTQQTALELKRKLEDLSDTLKTTQNQMTSLQKKPVKTSSPKPKKNPVSNTTAKKNKYDGAYALFKAGKYTEARKFFDNFLKTYPNDQLTDNALYWIGNCYFKEKKYEKAISSFEDIISRFPKSNKAPDAHYIQALAFLEINEPLTAKIILETLIQNFPSSPAASMARKKLSKLN